MCCPQSETRSDLESYVFILAQAGPVLGRWWEWIGCCCSNKTRQNFSTTDARVSLALHAPGEALLLYSVQSLRGSSWGFYSLLVLPLGALTLLRLCIRWSWRRDSCPGKFSWEAAHVTAGHITLARTSCVVPSNWKRFRKCRGAVHLCHR